MTEQKFEEYKQCKEELDTVKRFLMWCGDRYSKKGMGATS